jgi:YD repeat-containing protein
VTTTRPIDPPASAPAGEHDRRPLALVAAGIVATVIVALVLLVGVVRPPPLEPFTDPSFDGAAAVASWERDWCVSVIDADGARTQVRCDQQGGELVGWTDEGIVVRTWVGDREQETTLDPTSGEVVVTVDRPDAELEGWWPEPDLPSVGARDGRLEVRHDGEVLWSVDADEPYEVTAGWESPDGRWVALQDSAERLLLVPTDGSAPPAVWAEGVEPYATVVWRGAVTSRG